MSEEKGKKKNENLVKEVKEKLKRLGENEEIVLRCEYELETNYTARVGYFAKNGRGSYAIRVRYGINTLLKIRNSDDFNAIKEVIRYIEENSYILKALDELNASRTARKARIVDDAI